MTNTILILVFTFLIMGMTALLSYQSNHYINSFAGSLQLKNI